MWSGSGRQQWLPKGRRLGSEWELSAKKGKRRKVLRWKVQSYRSLDVWGHVVHAGSSDISGRGGEEHDRDERPAWMVGLAGGRFSSALNATVKNLTFL